MIFTQPAEPALVPMPTRIDDLPATLSFLQSQLGTGPDAPTLRLLPMGGQVHIGNACVAASSGSGARVIAETTAIEPTPVASTWALFPVDPANGGENRGIQ